MSRDVQTRLRATARKALAKAMSRPRVGLTHRGASVPRRVTVIVLVMSLVLATVPATGESPTTAANTGVGVPDHPLPLSFDPTSIKDLKDADPGAGIALVEPPTANPHGDARLSYPIQLPPGRQGIEPRLALQYSSGGGNGWLGLGWSLNVPAITIDTRWGVPRYDPTHESETYLLDGQQLSPVAHRGEPRPRPADADAKTTFHLRVEGSFSQITRHGTSPATYWWEIRDKQGTRYFYGGTPETGRLGAVTLTDRAGDGGNGFRWALHQVRDLHGNTMTYRYTEVPDSGVAGGRIPGRQLYLASINYTGSGETAGAYTVTFLRDRDLREANPKDNARRPDVIIDARGGFKMVTADLLKRIDVHYRKELVRRYELTYQTGAFEKQLLHAVTQHGADGSQFHTHTFSYNEETRGFDAPVPWTTGAGSGQQGIPGDDQLGWDITTGTVADVLLSPLQQYLNEYGQASALGGSVTDSLGGHVYMGYNQGAPAKPGSAGGKLGFNYSVNTGTVQLIDLNGDGLPDKVFKDPAGAMWYRLNRSGPAGSTDFGPISAIPSLPALSEETSITTSFGLEAYMAVNGMANQAETFTHSATYFSDINGDGLPDLVHRGRVLFNGLNAKDEPVFAADSSHSGVPLPPATVDVGGMIPDYSDLRNQQKETFPLHDTLRRWVAPYDGRVTISGDIRLLEGHPQPGVSAADGVRVAIQLGGTQLWEATLPPGDTTARSPRLGAVRVAKGQALYFRVHSIDDGTNDQVEWDPIITYVDVPSLVDVNGLNPYRYVASEDFTLAGRRDIFTQLPVAGSLRLAGQLEKKAATTDDVTVRLVKNDHEEVARHTIPWDQTGPINLTADIDVDAQDTIKLHVGVDSPIDLRQLHWASPARLHYTSTKPEQPVINPSTGEPLLVFFPPYDIDLYPVNNLSGPQAAWTVPLSGHVTVRPRLGATLPPQPMTGTITFTVKRQGQRLAKHSIEVLDGVPRLPSLRLEVSKGDRLFFDFASPDHRLTSALNWQGAFVDLRYAGTAPWLRVPSAFHSAAPVDNPEHGVQVFPQPYRGWAVAGYNGNPPRGGEPIKEALLRISPDVFGEDGKHCKDQKPPQDKFTHEDFKASKCNPTQVHAYTLVPAPGKGVWQGSDERAFVAPATMASTRLGGAGIPAAAEHTPMAASGGQRVGVPRFSRTSQTAVSASALTVGGSVSGAPLLPGSSHSEIDVLDLNGDGFPDIVGNGKVQYTTRYGGLGPQQPVAGLGAVRGGRNSAQNFGINSNVAHTVGGARGTPSPPRNSPPATERTGNQQVTLGLGLGVSWGRGGSDTERDLVDMNGDGLPDLVTRQAPTKPGTKPTLQVSLNLGYGFAAAEPWGEGSVNDGASRNMSVGPSLSFNTGTYDYAGGLSIARNTSYTSCSEVQFVETEGCDQPGYSWVDLNGDGLLDRVTIRPPDRKVPGDKSKLAVAVNTGQGFAAEQIWDGALPQGPSVSTGTTLGGGAYFTVGIPLCLASCFLIVNPGADYSRTMGRPTTALRDVDGDGYPDHVESTTTGRMSVALNRTGRSNLLKSVQRPLGAAIELEYDRSGNTPKQPGSRWVMSKVTVDDGHKGDGVDQLITTYRYADGVYNRLEREFYGYATVTQEHRDATRRDAHGTAALYRSVERAYDVDGYYTKGLLRREALRDTDGKVYTVTEHTYRLRDVASREELVDQDGLTGVVFPELAATRKGFHEGNKDAGVSTVISYDYDEKGNVTRIVDGGDVGPEDDLTTTHAYSRCPDQHVVATPTSTIITAAGVGRRSEADVDCATGTVKQVRQYLDDDTFAQTDLTYFPNGNLKAVTGPANHRGQRYAVTYRYDPDVATHIADTADSFGYRSTATYDPRHGLVQATTDINGNTTTYTYDTFARLETITGPYQQGGQPTVRFAYHPHAAVPWALTRHLDDFRDRDDPIDTVVFIDGLGRVVQTKKDATVHTGADKDAKDVMVVSGHVTFDFAGRTTQQRYPTTEPTGQPGVFNDKHDTIDPTQLAYDVIDRTVKTTLPDTTTTTSSHGFGPDRSGATRFQTTVTDANGNHKNTYTDVRGSVTAVQEFNNPEGKPSETIWTSYSYDPLQQLTEVHDDQNNVTRLAYDNLGRRTVVDNPDAGKTETVYDLASNVTATISASLRAQGEHVAYDYDFTRLKAVRYPNFPGNNVAYTYGAPDAAHNRAGRVVTVTDESGKEERFYGKLGEITREIKTVASDTQGNSAKSPEVYATDYAYDTFGRLQQLTYPDGEVLTYGYDSGGLVQSASGKKAGHTYEYVRRLEYDKFGQRAFTEAGNKVRTSYQYNDKNRRLHRLQAASGTQQLQNLAYGYDDVGNITSLDNEVPVGKPSEFGGPTTQTFTYDDLYRLTSAEGSYQQGSKKTSTYDLALEYDTIHNIIAKKQNHEVVQPSGTASTQKPTTYSWAYDYDGSQPHAATHIGDRTFRYDANGNQAGWEHDRNGTRRNITWDEENRMQAIADNGRTTTFKYDHSGRRVIKRGAQGETAYVNEHFSIRNREVGTKHVYVGASRVVAKMMKQDKPGANPRGKNPVEKDLYFFHPDHLGSSNYVTNTDGTPFQHTEFFPSGETWVDESSNTERTPYLYTGKELDEETGLYYFGARYLEPRTSTFNSTDPLTTSRPANAVGAAKFLSTYAYANHNPLRFIDPTGAEAVETASDVARWWEAHASETTTILEEWVGSDPSLAKNLAATAIQTAMTMGGGAVRLGGGSLGALSGWQDWQIPQPVVDFAAAFGSTLSFALTDIVNDATGASAFVDKGSGAYSSGEWSAMGLSAAFGGAHLGRNALYQGSVKTLIHDPRTWGWVRTVWSRAAGGLRSQGISLHHWLIPQRWAGVHAGFNYLPISAGLNSWMGSTALRRVVAEGSFRLVVLGIYGAPVTAGARR